VPLLLSIRVQTPVQTPERVENHTELNDAPLQSFCLATASLEGWQQRHDVAK